MHDTLPQAEGDASGAMLAGAGVTPAELHAALGAVLSEFAWQLEQITLSRGGLAGIVELIASSDRVSSPSATAALHSAAITAAGNAILGQVLGSADGSRALAARAARAAGLRGETGVALLPGLAVTAMAGLAARARNGLGEILAVLPALGRRSRGSPHADLADILRRGCGAGPYAPAKLRRVVRRSIARAAGFPARSALGWYLQFMLIRPFWRPMRALLVRASLARPAASRG